MFKSKTKKAFTIVELVIVIAVIAILMGIMFVGGTAISNNAKASTLSSDFRTFETNIKAMVNDPTASIIKTEPTNGFDPDAAAVKTLINSYFEGDIALKTTTFSDAVKSDTGAKVSRAAHETDLSLKDPYGVPYRFVVLDDSSNTVTDITFLVYSCGKNKQTSTTPNDGLFDKDDTAIVIRVVDSVIYTGIAAPEGTDIAYKDAVDKAAPAPIDTP